MLSYRRFERSTVLFVGLIIVSFVLTTLDVRASGGGVAGALRDVTQAVVSPVQRVAAAVTGPIVGFFDGVANLADLRRENDRLRSEVQSLQQRLDDNAAELARLEQLEAVHGLQTPAGIDTVTGQVYAAGVSDFDLIRRIDRGRSDGVVEGMAVVDESGLVGRIVQPVGDHTATVRLITDPISRVGVVVLGTGEAGWVTGQGDGPLLLEMTRVSEELREGDLLVTGGGRFPPGLRVGTVREDASAEAGFTLVTTVDPRVDFSRVDFVKVLLTTEADEPIEDAEDPADPQRILEEPPVDGEEPLVDEPPPDDATAGG